MDKTILVVEDETVLLEAIVKKLEINGFHVRSALTGDQALKILNDTSSRPDLIWLDFYLKDMDGLEFMKKLNANPLVRDLPVVVVSNSMSEDTVKEMMDMGVRRYMLKADYQLDELIKTVKELL